MYSRLCTKFNANISQYLRSLSLYRVFFYPELLECCNNTASPPKYFTIRTSKKFNTVSVKPNILSIFKFLLLSLKLTNTHTHTFFLFFSSRCTQDYPSTSILFFFFFLKLACRFFVIPTLNPNLAGRQWKHPVLTTRQPGNSSTLKKIFHYFDIFEKSRPILDSKSMGLLNCL